MTDPTPPFPVRTVTDPRELRALAHPTRMALLDLLHAEGPLTASQCGERLGESAASCSYHLRQLAKYGHALPAEGGRGRERPWRPRTEGIRWGGDDEPPAMQAAGELLTEVVDEHRFAAWRAYRDRRPAEPAEWRRAAVSTDVVAWLTAAELEELAQRVYDLWRPYVDRSTATARPPAARAVRFFAYAYPAPLP